MKILNLVAVCLCLALVSCEKRVQGQAFIVSKAGDSVKLGLVKVVALSESDALDLAKMFATLPKKSLPGSAAITAEEFVSKDLPKSLGEALTDADGNFSLTLPGAKKVAIVAIDSKKELHWFFWYDPSASSQPLILSNQNLMGMVAAESVIPETEPLYVK